jgi:hypothetical protein
MVTRRWWGWSVVMIAVGTVGLVGCSGGTGTTQTGSPPAATATAGSPEPESPTQEPEGQGKTSAAEVAAGLRKIDQIAQDIAASAGRDKARATSLAGQIEPVWKPIEDTIRANDQGTYLTMEDTFAVLEKAADEGDAAAAAKGAATISSAVRDYLAKYSG